MSITIRAIQTHAEFRAVEQLQRTVWGLPDAELVPTHLLLTAAKNGGLLLGAFDGEAVVGFVFGFPCLAADGKLKHCSHMAGVLPAYQSQNIGYQLKLAQRAQVLAQGIDLITWTFDPLESRNAYLNFHKLGVVCHTYLRNLYGEMHDELNAGLPSDRFQVEWWIASERVAQRLAGAPTTPAAAQEKVAARGDHLLVEIPCTFQSIKATDMSLAMQWRLQTRRLFEDAFSRGYTVTDLLHEAGRCHYLLERL